MAAVSVAVTLSVVCSLVEVRFACLESGEGANSAEACATAGASTSAEKQPPVDGEAAGASKEDGKIPDVSIDPAALAQEYTVLCAELQQTCEALCPPVPESAQPKIGPCIEGRSSNLESIVKFVCEHVPEEKEDVRVAVKNIIFQEANRKSYSHEKQRLKTANVMEDDQVSLLWRWEVKKPSCLGEHKATAMGVRGWLKKAQACMVAHHQAIKLFRGKAHATLYQRQVAAYKKAQTHEHPGAPPVAVEANPKPVPDDDVQILDADESEDMKCTQTQPNEPEHTQQCSPAEPSTNANVEAKPVSPTDGDDVVMLDTPAASQKKVEFKDGASGSPQKPARKSKDENAAAAALGFGKKRSLEKSRGMMEMFVRRAAPKTKPALTPAIEEQDKPSDTHEVTMAVDVLEGVAHISDGLQSKEDVDVTSEWQALLGGRWKSLGESMKNSRVPGLPPPFARKANAPRDPAKLAAMVLQGGEWQGVRTWRRKLFHFPADGNRPPFYGSFSRRSRIVGARTVFRKDPNLDYDIMSDEEWEEEPEGEDILGNDADDEEGGMDEEDEEDGSFMVADGYLSDDERAVDGGDSDGEDGPLCATDIAAPLAKEAFLHSVLSESVTNYLNALLNAKNSNQVVIMTRDQGSVTSVPGQKVRGPDLLEALQMHVIGEGCIRPYEMGSEPNINQQLAGKPTTAKPASATQEPKGSEGGALQPKELQNVLAASTAANTSSAAGTSQKIPSGLHGKPALSQKSSAPVQQLVVKKRRRIQAIPEAEPDSEGKPSTGRACDILKVTKPTAAPKCAPTTSSAPVVPSTAPTAHCSDAAAPVDEAMHACPEEGTAAVRVAPECPQPGQGTGEIARWMDANPDRLRLPGGIGSENLQSWLSPQALPRQEDPRCNTPTAANAADLSPFIQIVSSSPKHVASRIRGTHDVPFKDLSNVSCLPGDSGLLQLPSSPSTPKTPVKQHKKFGLDSGMCRLQLNSKRSAPAGPVKGAIDLCGGSARDWEDDFSLQAALLASMHEPAGVADPGEECMAADVVNNPQFDTLPSIPDGMRVAVIETSVSELQDEREQMYNAVLCHLKECCQHDIKDFTSWRQLATYFTLAAGRKRRVKPDKPLMGKALKWIKHHFSRVPESFVLVLAQASLCDRHLFNASRAAFLLANCAVKFFKGPENAAACSTHTNKISLYTFTAHRGLLRTLHRRLARSLVEIEEAVSSGDVTTEIFEHHIKMSSHVLLLLAKAVDAPRHAGDQLAALLSSSSLKVPGSNFLNVLVRLVAATTTLESTVEGNTKVTADITRFCYQILQLAAVHNWPDSPGGFAEPLLTHPDCRCLFVNLIKDGLCSEGSPKGQIRRRALAMECLHGMLSVCPESTQKAHAADFLAALGEFCNIPDRHQPLARAAWQALNAAHNRPGPTQTALTSAIQASNASSEIQVIGKKIDKYKKELSEKNDDDVADESYFVLMQTAFRKLEGQVEAQKDKLNTPAFAKTSRPAPRRPMMNKNELPFTVPQTRPALKPGVTIPTASGMVRPRDSEAEEGSDIGAAISKRKSHDSVQPVKESKGAKMLRMASGK